MACHECTMTLNKFKFYFKIDEYLIYFDYSSPRNEFPYGFDNRSLQMLTRYGAKYLASQPEDISGLDYVVTHIRLPLNAAVE